MRKYVTSIFESGKSSTSTQFPLSMLVLRQKHFWFCTPAQKLDNPYYHSSITGHALGIWIYGCSLLEASSGPQNPQVAKVVNDQNLVSVSATETKIKFRYRFRCRNFFCLNLNFPSFFLTWFLSPKTLWLNFRFEKLSCCYQVTSLFHVNWQISFPKMPNYLPNGYLCPRIIEPDISSLLSIITRSNSHF